MAAAQRLAIASTIPEVKDGATSVREVRCFRPGLFYRLSQVRHRSSSLFVLDPPTRFFITEETRGKFVPNETNLCSE